MEERITVSTIREIANKLPTDEAKSQIMTLAEYIREEGREEGLLIGQIITCREIIGLPAVSPQELRDHPLDELRSVLADLKAAVGQKLRP